MAADVAKIEGVQPCETAVSGYGFAKRKCIHGHQEPPECAAGTAAMCNEVRGSLGTGVHRRGGHREWVRNWVT